MRVLLDEQVPVGLAPLLQGHEVQTVRSMGWSGVTNGELLRRTAGLFEAFLTMDRQLPGQQDLALLPFGVLLVRAKSNRLADLAPLVPQLLATLSRLKPGQLHQVGG